MNAEDIETERIEAQVESRRHRAEGRRNRAEHRRFLTKVDKYLAKGDTRNVEVATHLAEFYRLLAEANTFNADAKNILTKAYHHRAESKRLHAESGRLINEADSLYAKAENLISNANGFNWWVFPIDRHEKIAKAKRMITEGNRLNSTGNRTMTKAARIEEKGNKHLDDANRLYAESDRLQVEAERYITEAQIHFDEAKRIDDIGNLLDYNFWQIATIGDVARILDRDEDLESRSDAGLTPLHLAVSNSSKLEVISLLLDRGANIDARDDNGCMPLHWAAQFSKVPEVVALLLDRGANTKAQDAEGKTPFDCAEENQHLIGSDVYWRLKETKFSNVPAYRIEKEQLENNQSSDVSKQAPSIKTVKKKQRQVKNNQINKKQKRIPSFLKGEKKLVELLEYFEKDAILTLDWHKRNVSQEEKKKINEEFTHINKEIRKYPSSSLFQRRIKQRAIREYGKVFDDLNKNSCLLQRRAELWMIKKEYKKAIADLNDAKRKKEMAEKIEKTKAIGKNTQKGSKESKPKELQRNEKKNTKKAEQKKQQDTKKEDNTDAAMGCGCLLVLILIGVGVWRYFLDTDEPAVNQILTWLWVFPTWMKWSLIFLFGIVVFFAFQAIKKQSEKKKDEIMTGCSYLLVLVLIGAGVWRYFFGTNEPAIDQILALLTWNSDFPDWMYFLILIFYAVCGVACVLAFWPESDKRVRGFAFGVLIICASLMIYVLIGVVFWILFF